MNRFKRMYKGGKRMAISNPPTNQNLDTSLSFGQILKQLRQQHNITQQKLAEILETSKSNISKYESDIIEPSFTMLRHISILFDVSIDYLLGISSELQNKEITFKSSSINTIPYTSELEKYLMDTFHTLTKAQQYIILGKVLEMSEMTKQHFFTKK